MHHFPMGIFRTQFSQYCNGCFLQFIQVEKISSLFQPRVTKLFKIQKYILISVLWCKSITFQCKLCKVHQNIRNCKSIQPMFVFWTFITKIYLHHSNAIHFLAIGSNFWCKFYKIYVPAKCNMFLYPKDA